MSVPYSDLVAQAKERQQTLLQTTKVHSQQLHKSIQAIVASNSTNDGANSSSVLDKITTIHQLDKQIDKQLDEGIANNYAKLVKSNNDLEKLISSSNRRLHQDNKSIVDELQRRAEKADQNLRILETTLKLLREQV
ncbi:hypothetical protein CAAN1_03S04544 [[Candida] anglica]|uniref:Biogenesis of lysosome-related organelles complex 1 subunit 1 n=1 Tax=[Candida] anglica TaxID=148631 RepID=A0ABP0EIM9_9ASCO